MYPEGYFIVGNENKPLNPDGAGLLGEHLTRLGISASWCASDQLADSVKISGEAFASIEDTDRNLGIMRDAQAELRISKEHVDLQKVIERDGLLGPNGTCLATGLYSDKGREEISSESQ